MKKRSGLYPRVGIDAAGSGVVSQAGGVTLVETLRVSGLDAALSREDADPSLLVLAAVDTARAAARAQVEAGR